MRCLRVGETGVWARGVYDGECFLESHVPSRWELSIRRESDSKRTVVTRREGNACRYCGWVAGARSRPTVEPRRLNGSIFGISLNFERTGRGLVSRRVTIFELERVARLVAFRNTLISLPNSEARETRPWIFEYQKRRARIDAVVGRRLERARASAC